MPPVFIHGLDSSSQGTKARFFSRTFPGMIIRDYTGSLARRLEQLDRDLEGQDNLVLVGSSFGGLMAAIFAINNPARVKRIVLLAPALNFPDFSKYLGQRCDVPAFCYIGRHDTVTPPSLVAPAVRAVFSNLTYQEYDDDHLLHTVFATLPWQDLLL